MHHAFNESERADSKLLKFQLANLQKGIVNGKGKVWDSDSDYGQLIGVKLDDRNVSDISSDPYSDVSSCGSDVE